MRTAQQAGFDSPTGPAEVAGPKRAWWVDPVITMVSGVILGSVGFGLLLVPFVGSLLGAKHLAVPGTSTLQLKKQWYTISEFVGRKSEVRVGLSSASLTSTKAPRLRPDSFRIDGPRGPVEVELLGTDETTTLNDRVFVGVVRFSASTAGEYRVTISGERRGEVIVTKAFRARSLLLGLGVGFVGGVLGFVGFVWMIVRYRRPRAPSQKGSELAS